MSTRERLVTTTQELLWERGYVGTSPRAIQDRSGAGQGSMYHHFRTKQELAEEAIARSAEQMKAQVEEDLASVSGAFEQLEAFLRRERDVLRGCRIGRLTQDPDIVGSSRLRTPVQDTMAWLVSRIAKVLDEGQRAGQLRLPAGAHQVAATIVAALQGGYVLARAAQSPEPFDDAIDGVLSLLTLTRSGTTDPGRKER
jgi:AcrR family transcriptional regulator